VENLVRKVRLERSFWKNKKVFLTGHTGFKGSWLTIWLNYLGAEVLGFSLDPITNPNLFTEADLSGDLIDIRGDIRDYNKLSRSMSEFQPEIIIHMAAQPLVRYSYKEPIETFTTNIVGTANIFESARNCTSVKAILNVTTDKCYENMEWDRAYTENDTLGGHDPYSSSKACSEIITSAYKKSYLHDAGISIASARAGNVIGGGDWSDDRLIPDILNSFEENKIVVIRNPKSVRPWQHVLEPLSGYLLLVQNLYNFGDVFAQPWNFGPYDKDSKQVEYIVNKIKNIWGNDANWEIDENPNPHEAKYLKLDISKAINNLNWEPKWNLDNAIERIVIWHKSWRNGANVKNLCLKEIEDYEKYNE